MSNTQYWENLVLIVVLVLESKSSLIVQSYCVLGLDGIRDLTKIHCGIRETLTGSRICLLPE